MNIRKENTTDYSAVKSILQQAFIGVPHSDQQEHLLVERLRLAPTFIPELSLVAEIDGRVVGHILLTPIEIISERQRTPSLALAPVSVLPEWQGRGIGGRLIEAAHERAHTLGYDSVVLLGHADYYPRFGYRPCQEFGITLPFPAPPENCLAIALTPGALEHVTGEVAYPAAFFEAV